MSRCANPQPLPFGVRRPPDRVQVRLSKLELLFVGLAMSALIYLGSLGPRMEDPWMDPGERAHTLCSSITRTRLLPQRRWRVLPTPNGYSVHVERATSSVLQGLPMPIAVRGLTTLGRLRCVHKLLDLVVCVVAFILVRVFLFIDAEKHTRRRD